MTPPIHTIRAPAKLNIRLKITGRRPDGYHDLVSIMVPITLFDRLEVEVTSAPGIVLTSSGLPVPEDEGNLVYQAAQAFFSRTGLEAGASVRLTKAIPVAAGMGGGSSDAASTLLILNQAWGRPLTREDLHDLAVGLGADVPFFLHGAPALARGIGDILEPIEAWPGFWYVIITPPVPISTSWVYGNYKLRLTRDEHDSIRRRLARDPMDIRRILENDLETVTSARFPIIDSIKRSLIDAGAEGALMTGSGPSVFGVFRSSREAQAAKNELLPRNLGDLFVAADWKQDICRH